MAHGPGIDYLLHTAEALLACGIADPPAGIVQTRPRHQGARLKRSGAGLERLVAAQIAPLAERRSPGPPCDADALETHHFQADQFAHAPDLRFLHLAQNEAQLILIQPAHLRRAQCLPVQRQPWLSSAMPALDSCPSRAPGIPSRSRILAISCLRCDHPGSAPATCESISRRPAGPGRASASG